ncbi:MAG: hypothetical protein EBY09_15675, partial [Verrucomicrobia bacterium]|nr:hypothetical protein [Verrucomicrobiota bacterium]
YLVAVGYMDPGNWATDLAGGSKFGYTLLSVILIRPVRGHLTHEFARGGVQEIEPGFVRQRIGSLRDHGQQEPPQAGAGESEQQVHHAFTVTQRE